MSGTALSNQAALSSAISKAAKRLVPFALLLYLLGYIDRVNIGFASLTMNKDLGFSPVIYGLGASMFFVGYVLFEVPSNMLLFKYGPRRWISRIMITWGIISVVMCLIKGAYSFYIVRFLLGVAEAGFFPGIIFFLTQWFPAAKRGRMIATFMVGQVAAGIFGGPISTSILAGMNGIAGLAGWQWLFIIEGFPSVLIGLVCLGFLTDKPAEAKWLEPEERVALQTVIDSENKEIQRTGTHRVLEGFKNIKIYLLGAVFFCVASGIYGSIFWVPQIVKTFGVSNFEVGFISALPYIIAAVISVLWAHDSDRRQERVWHVALPSLLSCVGFLISSIWLHTPVVAMIGLTFACIGMYSVLPIFWTLPVSFLTGPAAAGGLALITSLGNISGIVTPAVVGWIRQATGGFSMAMLALSGISLLACLLTFACRPPVPRQHAVGSELLAKEGAE